MPPNMPPFALKTAQYYGKYFIHINVYKYIIPTIAIGKTA